MGSRVLSEVQMNFNHILWLVPDDENYVYISYVNAMRQMGLTASLMNYKEEITSLGLKGFEQRISSLLTNSAVDLVIVNFYGRSFGVTPHFLRKLSALARVVILAGDDEVYSTRQTVYFAQAVDAVVTTDISACHLYQQLGCPSTYFPFPSLDLENDESDLRKEIDVSFVGNCNRKDRKRYIDFLRDHGINTKVYGVGSENGYADRNEMIQIFKRSCINLNFTGLPFDSDMYRQEPWRSHLRQVKGRPFEVAGTKSFCLSEYAPALSRNFEIGKEIDVFHDEHELLEKVKYYLKNEQPRETIAVNAYSRVRKDYAPSRLIGDLLATLSSLFENPSTRRKNKKIFLGHEFNAKRAQDDLVFAASIVMKGYYRNAMEIFFAISILKDGSCTGLLRGFAYLGRRALSVVRIRTDFH